MDSTVALRTRLSALTSTLRPSRPTLIVFGLLVGLEVQYFVRNIIDGVTPPGFDSWLPIVGLDLLLEALLVPVHWLVGLAYEQWAPDWVHFLVTCSYFYVLAVVIAALYRRLSITK